MSSFDPSPRSSKRRKATTQSGPSQTPTKSVYSNISRAVTGISRNLFKTRAQSVAAQNADTSSQTRDSAYGSKEDSLEGEDHNAPASQSLSEGRPESADELASPEVTATPTKSKRRRAKADVAPAARPTTPDPVQDAPDDQQDSASRLRSSGRERRKPKRFDNPSPQKASKTVNKSTPRPAKESLPKKSPLTNTTVETSPEELTPKAVPASWKPAKSHRKGQRKSTKAKGAVTTPYPESPSTNALEDGQPGQTPQPEDEEDIEQVEDHVGDGQELSLPQVPVLDVPHTEVANSLSDPQLDPLKTLVLRRLTGQDWSPLTNLESEYNKVHFLLSATVKAGEGNSMLLLGCRGAGKSCLVETAISDLTAEHAQDFHVVRLNGFIQSDDKLALREIWRQLGREMEVQEEALAQVMTLADTMASLLHLLSHPEELVEVLDPDAPARTAKSIIFVLDEFDLFTTHPRQTLLYNLFDIAQARKAPIAIIGCSTRIDVTDNLEKRVKSRFSHRWVYVPQAKSLPAFESIARAALTVGQSPLDLSLEVSKKLRDEWNTYVEVCFSTSGTTIQGSDYVHAENLSAVASNSSSD